MQYTEGIQQAQNNTFPVTYVCSSVLFFLLNTREFECERRTGLLSQRKNKAKTVRGAGAQDVVDLLKQHVRLTVCVWVLSDSTKHVSTWPDGIVSMLARSIAELAPAF